jgi:hypothetical protein
MNAAQRLEKAMSAAEDAASALMRHARRFNDDEADWRLSALLQKARIYAAAMRRVSRVARRRL